MRSMDVDTMAAMSQVIAAYEHFTISTHIHPDGDAIGSQLAFYSFLKELGKHVVLINRDPVPANLRFLPNADEISAQLPSQPSEVLIVLDAGDLTRIGEELVEPLRPQYLTLNIDHHAHCCEFGDYNLIMPEACATAEILYYFFTKHAQNLGITRGDEIGHERAVCLYTGIMYDTGCFRYSNATPAAHQVAAELVTEGVAVDEIYDSVYECIPVRKIRLLSDVLQTFRLSCEERCAWLYVTQQMLKEHGATEEDLDGFINYIRAIDTVEVALLFSETRQGKTKVSFRSKGAVDVGAISASLGGGGHQRAAGCTLSEDRIVVIPYVVKKVGEAISSNANSIDKDTNRSDSRAPQCE